ncbi:unnamed protein product, partial [Medioppia subpectinata]
MTEVMPPFNQHIINTDKSFNKHFQQNDSQMMDRSNNNGVTKHTKLNGNIDDTTKTSAHSVSSQTDQTFRPRIVWSSVLKLSFIHIVGIYGMYNCATYAKYMTVVWYFAVAMGSSFGILCGAHRLWSHRCYKAHTSLRALLMVLQTLALQNDIYEWSRDHRVHHKYSETDADPHNSNRGFFFSHMGWLMTKKHPQVIQKGKLLDMSDLMADPVVRFQRKYYAPLVLLIWGVIPTIIPCYFLSETLLISFSINMTRYILSLHQTWLVNSAAHMFGFRTYDRDIGSRENQSVVYLSFGEGYHNYHHTFPYDYSASEYGWKSNYNLATAFIDFFALIGLAYDLKTTSDKSVADRKERTGDHMKVTLWPLWAAYLGRVLSGHNLT